MIASKRKSFYVVNFVFPKKIKNPTPIDELNINLIQLVLN